VNKYEKLQVQKMRAKMRAEQTLAKFREVWYEQEPQMAGGKPSVEGEVPAPQIEETK